MGAAYLGVTVFIVVMVAALIPAIGEFARAIGEQGSDWVGRFAASTRRSYQPIIVRSLYLTGALELEGAIDPGELLEAGMKTFAGARSASDILGGWRYQLDAVAAGDTHLVIGFEVTDTGERYTVEVRNSVIVLHEGRLADEAAVVRLTSTQFGAAAAPGGTFEGCEVTGDSAAAEGLLALLDREITGFSMHRR